MAAPSEEFLRRIGAMEGPAPAPTAATNVAGAVTATGRPSDAFLSRIGAIQSRVTPAPEAILPESNQALQGMGLWSQNALIGPQALAERESRAIAESQVPGIPLDVQTGASALTRLRLGAERNRMEQLNLLRSLYGEDAVRMDKQGNWIVRSADESGKPKDILVNETSLSVGDLAAVANKAPALALSLMATKGLPAGAVVGTALRGALGWMAGEAAVDVASRVGRRDIDPTEIIGTHGYQAMVDTAFGYGLGKGINMMGTFGRMLRLASTRAPDALGEPATAVARARIEQARQTVSAETGTTLEPTVGELTGNPIIQRLEAFLANIPLARGFILRNLERRMANEREIQRVLMVKAGGFESVPDVTRLGEEVLGALSQPLRKMEGEAAEAATALRGEAQGALAGPLESLQPITPLRFGERMIRRGEAQLESFKARATELYDRIRAVPESQMPAFDATPIMAKARQLEDELTKTATGDVATAFAPSGTLPVLDQVRQLPPNQTYFDLVKLRDAVYDRIGSPEPISDRGTRLLKGIGASISEQLEKQGPQVFGPRKWPLVEEATKYYRENVESFYQKGISGMLKPRTEAGAIDPERVASQLLAGGKGSATTYQTFRDFFEKTGAVKDMNRLLRSHIIDAGTDSATGLIKLEDLAQGVSKMEPEVVQALYGQKKDVLLKGVQEAQLGLRVFGKAGAIPERGTQAAVEADALKEMLDKGNVTSASLKKLASASTEIQKAYTTELQKSLALGDTGVVEAAPEKFVRDFLLNPSTPERAAQNAMSHLYASGDDLLVGDVRRFYLGELFKGAAAQGRGDVQQLVGMQTGSPLRTLDPQKFAVMLENEGVRKRMDLILGPETASTVRELGIALSGRAGRDIAATTTGAFVGGGQTHQIIQALGGKWSALKVLPELAQYRVISFLLTHPESIKTFRTIASAVPADVGPLMKAMALSPEFKHVLESDSATPAEAAQVMRDIQQWAAPQNQQPTR